MAQDYELAEPSMAGLTREEVIRTSRAFDYIVVPIIFFLLVALNHIHVMLLAGDWDFWVDWKDRRYWIVMFPIATVCFPAAVQYIFWEGFRLPLGATLCAVALIFGEWVTRAHAFVGWSEFPYSMVWPATIIPGALVLDMVLMLTRNFVLTGVAGALLFGVLFYPGNYPLMAPYRVPVENHGLLMSVADLIGFEYVRTATPEYLRFIESGTLRTFGVDVAPVSSFFAGFLCMLIYFAWWFLGKAFSSTKFISMGFFSETKDQIAELRSLSGGDK
jgi:methane/ammonia monooxygenase subunit A